MTKYILATILSIFLMFSPLNAAELVNLNEATAQQLDTLPGIGPAKAQAIVDYRTKNGTFWNICDLTKVHGIGPATRDKLKPYVTLGTDKPDPVHTYCNP